MNCRDRAVAYCCLPLLLVHPIVLRAEFNCHDIVWTSLSFQTQLSGSHIPKHVLVGDFVNVIYFSIKSSRFARNIISTGDKWIRGVWCQHDTANLARASYNDVFASLAHTSQHTVVIRNWVNPLSVHSDESNRHFQSGGLSSILEKHRYLASTELFGCKFAAALKRLQPHPSALIDNESAVRFLELQVEEDKRRNAEYGKQYRANGRPNLWRSPPFGWFLFFLAALMNAGGVLCIAFGLGRNRCRGASILMGVAMLVAGMMLTGHAAHLTLGF